MPIPQTIIRFPEIKLQARDAHKLRGYFGNLFMEKSELLHNHLGDGGFKYAYPQVQYKVIDGTPLLVGLKEGAQLLNELFLSIRELNIDGEIIPIHQKNIEGKQIEIGVDEHTHIYQFKTRWMGVNQKNHSRYNSASSQDRAALLNRILTGNILSFFKGMDCFVNQQIVVNGKFQERNTQFKNTTMLAFEGVFETNAALPNYIGLGKSVARGFGSVERV